MNTHDGLFEIYKYEIPFKSYGDTIDLIPLGDIHYDSSNCDRKRFHELCKWAKKNKGAYIFGMGDYLDAVSFSERRILFNSDLHESTSETFNKMYLNEAEEILEHLLPLKGRIIGLMEGNHYAVLLNGITTTQWLCEKLCCKYLGTCCFVRLCLVHDPHHHHKVDVFAHHGLGSARKLGSSLSKVEGMTDNAEADLYLMGHDHKKLSGDARRLYLEDCGDELVLKQKKVVFARTGSFLKGYLPGKQNYIVDKMLPPSDLGVIKVMLTPQRKNGFKGEKRRDERWVDIHLRT